MVRSSVLFRRPIKAALLVGAVVAVNVAAAGCSGNGGNAGPPTSTTVPPRLATTTAVAPATSSAPAPATSRVVATTPPTTATPTVDDAAQEILAVENAYRAGMAAIGAATVEPVNPNHTGLDATLAGEMLTGWRDRIARRQAEGTATRPGDGALAVVSIRSVTVNGEIAQLLSCEIDDWVQYRVSDGVITNGDISTSIVDAELRRLDGIWKIVARVPRSVEKGRASCAQ